MAMTGYVEVAPTGLVRHTFAWESDSSGRASIRCDGLDHPVIVGVLNDLTTVPDSTAAPAVDYDVTLIDQLGHDVLGGAGADRSATDPEIEGVASELSGVRLADEAVGGQLTLTVANAGNAKRGLIGLYVRPAGVATRQGQPLPLA